MAVLAVVCVHMPNDAPGGWRENPWFFASYLMRLGYFGVPLFILLSGYCIHRKAVRTSKTNDAFKVNWQALWKRRFWRLYPPYAIALIVGLLLPNAFGVDLSNQWLGTFDRNSFGKDLVTHLTMTHNLTVEYNTGMRNGVYWTLGLEEQLYALYPVLILILLKANWRICLATIGTVSAVWQFLSPRFPSLPVLDGVTIGSFHAWPFNYWLHWTLGALAVSAVEGQTRIWRGFGSPRFCFLSLATGLLLNKNFVQLAANIWPAITLEDETVATIESIGSFFIAASLFSVLVWTASNETHWFMKTRVSAALAQIGKMSYSIYLLHVPAILVVAQFDKFEPSGMGWLLRSLTYLAASLLLGLAFYILIERWFLSGALPDVVGRITRKMTVKGDRK